MLLMFQFLGTTCLIIQISSLHSLILSSKTISLGRQGILLEGHHFYRDFDQLTVDLLHKTLMVLDVSRT